MSTDDMCVYIRYEHLLAHGSTHLALTSNLDAANLSATVRYINMYTFVR